MIQSMKRFNQFIDFSGITVGTIRPTDSDGEIEYHDKAWIFFEIKYNGKLIPYGQRVALERKINDLQRGGKEAVLFIADHDIEDAEIDVDAAACHVRCYYYRGTWYNGDERNLKEFVDAFIKSVDSMPSVVGVTV